MDVVKRSEGGDPEAMRPVIVKALVVCLAVAVMPWLSGGQEPLGMLISGFALLLGALLVWRQPLARVLKRGPLVWSYGLLMGFALLSLLWTANRYSSVLWVVEWLMAGLAFRLAYAVSGDARGRKWAVKAYLISAVVFCVVAILMYLTSQYGRLTGTFYWANPAAAYLLPAIVLGIDGVRRSRGRSRSGWFGLTILFGGSFLLTDSRAATAVLFVILGMYLLLVKLNRHFWVHLLFILVMTIVVSLGLVKLGTILVQHSDKVAPGSRIAEAVKGESTSGSDRLYYLESAFNMWFSHPLGGVGAGAYADVHPQFQQRVVSASTNAHNVYVQVLAELGLVGAMLLATLLLCLMLGSLRGLVVSPELVPLAIGTFGIMLHMGIDIDAGYPALLGLVGMFFGLLYAQNHTEWVKLTWRWPVLAMLVLVPVVELYFSESWADRGRAAQADQDYELAAADFEQATNGLIYNPDLVTADGINRFALALGGGAMPHENGLEIDAALAKAREAERLDPYDAQHHQLEGRVLAQKGDLKGAEAAFDAALKLDRLNHPDYALDLAQTLVRDGQTPEAVKVAQSMLDLYPAEVVSNRAPDDTVAPALANLEALVGNAALDAGDLNGAGAAADRALKLDPGNLRGRALKHQVEKRRG